MGLFYLDKGGLTAFWGKVKGLFSKTKPVFINFHSTGNHFWYNNYNHVDDDWWVFDSITSVDGEVLTNEQLYQLYSNGAPIYLVMNSIVSNNNYYVTIPLFSQLGSLSTPSHYLIFRSQEGNQPGSSSSDKTITVYISTSSPYIDPEIWYIVPTTQDAVDVLYTDYSGNISATNVKDAIDEVYSDIPEDASEVSYDNTSSSLLASNVQDAIDEVVTNMPSDADDISYDNTTSGLTATNVKDAIDEVAAGGGGGSSTLAGLSDVSMGSPYPGQFLTYGGGYWSNDTVEIDDIDDVDIVSPASGQILEYDGTDWVNSDTLKNINSGIDNEGERSASITSGASNWENLREVTLTKGVWLLIGFVNYPKMTTQPTSDNSGYCGALISNTSNASSANYYGTVIVGRARDEVTRIQVVTIRNVTKSSEKYYLEAKHYNVAGTASSARGELWHIRLR